MPDVWERKKKESDPAWAAFVLYRDMGEDRTLAEVGRRSGKSAPLMEMWSAKHDWVARCHAYDNHFDQLMIKQREKRWLKSREKVINLGEGMRTVAGMGVKRLVRVNESGESVLLRDLEPSEIVALASNGVKIENEGYGKATETAPQINIDARRVQNVQVNINNLDGPDYKEILALERELGFVRKLKPPDGGNGVGGNGAGGNGAGGNGKH